MFSDFSKGGSFSAPLHHCLHGSDVPSKIWYFFKDLILSNSDVLSKIWYFFLQSSLFAKLRRQLTDSAERLLHPLTFRTLCPCHWHRWALYCKPCCCCRCWCCCWWYCCCCVLILRCCCLFIANIVITNTSGMLLLLLLLFLLIL